MYNGMLLLLSHFSHVRFCATPQTAAHQAPPSLGFSRQEHWEVYLFELEFFLNMCTRLGLLDHTVTLFLIF